MYKIVKVAADSNSVTHCRNTTTTTTTKNVES